MRVIRCTAALVVLTLLLGLHWSLLQTIAWTRMFLTYSQSAPFSVALRMTFDGRHPCNLCVVVREGKAMEQRQHSPATEIREILECDVPASTPLLLPPPVNPPPPHIASFIPARRDAPPKPRPRSESAA